MAVGKLLEDLGIGVGAGKANLPVGDQEVHAAGVRAAKSPHVQLVFLRRGVLVGRSDRVPRVTKRCPRAAQPAEVVLRDEFFSDHQSVLQPVNDIILRDLPVEDEDAVVVFRDRRLD